MRLACVILLASLSATAACASRSHSVGGRDTTADSLALLLDAKAPAWLEQYTVPSVAVAYIDDGVVRWTRVYGEQARGVPATTRTLYNVASLTKPVFAETMLQLVAAGRLSLDEPMASSWVDPDVAGDPRHLRLTLRTALSHRMGFANWRRETGGVLRFQADPGTEYRYSGEGFEYARHFAERKLGVPIDSLARQHVFAPFAMHSTSFVKQPWFADHAAAPLGPEGKYGEHSFSERGNAADDLHATIGDYAAFVTGVMNRRGLSVALAGQRDSVHAIDTGSAAECRKKLGARCAAVFGYGLGWSIMKFSDHRVLWHTGSDWGEKAMVFYSPERRDGVVILTNGANGFGVIVDVAMLLSQDARFVEFLGTGK
jgi:CubicO group peptidase (beta-lactamase class C family)